MGNRKLLAGILVVAAVAVAAGVLLYSPRPRPSAEASLPYYKRTGFLSKLLLELNTVPKGLESIHVPGGFEVEVAARPGLVSYPMFVAFDDRGRLFVCESAGRNISDEEMDRQAEMRIRLLEGTDGDGVFDRSTIFADKISMAMGAQWYRGSLYVAAPPDVQRFEDTDGDGVADRRQVVLTGWPLHSDGTTLHGPYLAPDGWMYLTYNLGRYNIKTKEGTGDLMPAMTKFARIAPAGLALYRGAAFGREYEGNLFSAQFNPRRSYTPAPASCPATKCTGSKRRRRSTRAYREKALRTPW